MSKVQFGLILLFSVVTFCLMTGPVPSQAAASGNLSIAVRDTKGMPVRDAVVMIYPANARASGNFQLPGRPVMNQRDIAFDPGTLIIAPGTVVSFPNRDRVRHNVYSFSKAAKFSMKLYGRDQSRSHRFPIAGTVALGCNIHDEMKGYIKIVDTPYAGKTDHNGLVAIKGLPGGGAELKVWHPKNRVRGGETSQSVTLGSAGTSSKKVILDLRR